MRLKLPVLLARAFVALVLVLAAVTAGKAQAPSSKEPSLGDPNAPVTMIEYFSLTCPHCASFHKNTLPALKERYIDTGKVRLVLRDFPLDEAALKAAVVAHCAGPERYPSFVDVFLKQQPNWARANDPVQALKQLAKLGGLGEAQVDACLADQELEKKVLQTSLDAQQNFNVRSTPTFIVNGKSVPNGSVEDFAAVIDPLLKN